MNLRTQAEVRLEALEKQVDFLTGMMLSLLVAGNPTGDLEDMMRSMEAMGFDRPRELLAVIRENYQATMATMLDKMKPHGEGQG